VGCSAGFTQGGAVACGAAAGCCAGAGLALAGVATIFLDLISTIASSIASFFHPTESSCCIIWSSTRLFWRALRMKAMSFSLTMRPQPKISNGAYKFA